MLELSKSYSIPASAYETVYEVKKSRFIARVAYAGSRNQAMELLAKAKADYPDARHHCWAYLLGAPESASSAAMSDDGEPSGTAGKPILNVLQHKNVGDVMLIVIRYFGGIKLGAGGLVRAYSSAAQQAMLGVSYELKVATRDVTIECGYELEQSVRHWCEQHDSEVQEVVYRENVRLLVAIPLVELQQLEAFLGGSSARMIENSSE